MSPSDEVSTVNVSRYGDEVSAAMPPLSVNTCSPKKLNPEGGVPLDGWAVIETVIDPALAGSDTLVCTGTPAVAPRFAGSVVIVAPPEAVWVVEPVSAAAHVTSTGVELSVAVPSPSWP